MRLDVVIKLLFPVFLFIFNGAHHSHAQIAEDPSYSGEEIFTEQFDEKQWSSFQKELDYTEKEPELKTDNQARSYSLPFTIDSLFIKSLLFVIAAIVLIFILMKILNRAGISNTRIPKTEYTLATIEEDIHNSDLEGFLSEAIKNRDYKQVVRIYYLIIIRELSDKKQIAWKKDKTNYQYLQEMNTSPDFKVFKELTHYFEYIWYSKISFSEEQYVLISDRFKGYVERLKGSSGNI